MSGAVGHVAEGRSGQLPGDKKSVNGWTIRHSEESWCKEMRTDIRKYFADSQINNPTCYDDS